MLLNFLIYKIAAVSHLEAIV